MAKKSKSRRKAPTEGPNLYAALSKRRYRVLILPRVLREEADNFKYRGERQEKAHAL